MKRADKASQEKRPVGRPAGSGDQLPPAERVKKSRDHLAASGAARLAFSLDGEHSQKLTTLQEHWQCKTRKEVVEHALDIACQVINNKQRETR